MVFISTLSHSQIVKLIIMATATITAQDINKLRQATGAGMMDCRKALTETNGDFKQPLTGCANKVKK